jgi:hypothetical protein
MTTYLEFDDNGTLIRYGGICKAKDFKKEIKEISEVLYGEL